MADETQPSRPADEEPAASEASPASGSPADTNPVDHEPENRAFVFPRWANYLLPLLVLGAVGGAAYTPVAVYLALNPNNLNKLYRPEQPVPYSHAVHVGQLGMDCTYCHTTVNDAAFAAIPPTQTCVACHGAAPSDAGDEVDDRFKGGLAVKSNSTKLEQVYESAQSGKPIEWIKVHDIADYAYFNHSAHVTKGVACVTCHGRVDQMGEEGVHQHSNLSMSWCIECHRAPEEHLRPRGPGDQHGLEADRRPPASSRRSRRAPSTRTTRRPSSCSSATS